MIDHAHPPATLFLWPGQALYIGSGHDSSIHHHYALQIGLGVDEPLHIRATPQDAFTAVAGFIVAPNVPHQVHSARAQALFVWSERHHTVHPLLGTRAVPGIHALTDSQLHPLLPLRAASASQPYSCADATALRDAVLRTLLLDDSRQRPLDPRIAASLQWLRSEALELHPRPVHDLARHVQLSASRFRHLFKQQIGISVQRYVVWQRVLHALQASIHEPSLTGAAHTAGFADSAHFARVFRATFGLTPSAILKDSHSVQVIPCLVE